MLSPEIDAVAMATSSAAVCVCVCWRPAVTAAGRGTQSSSRQESLWSTDAASTERCIPHLAAPTTLRSVGQSASVLSNRRPTVCHHAVYVVTK